MRLIAAARALAATVVIGVAAPAAGFNCYQIVDKTNEVIYQDVTSPIDLSNDGAMERDALRARGQQLVALDTDRCPAIDRGRVAGGPATVDEIVAGMRSAVPYGGAARGAPAPAGSRGSVSLPRIRVPVATGGGMSPAVPASGTGIRY